MSAGIKNTETPIFQRISVVLPKLYLGARRDKYPTIKTQIKIFLTQKFHITPRYAVTILILWLLGLGVIL